MKQYFSNFLFPKCMFGEAQASCYDVRPTSCRRFHELHLGRTKLFTKNSLKWFVFTSKSVLFIEALIESIIFGSAWSRVLFISGVTMIWSNKAILPKRFETNRSDCGGLLSRCSSKGSCSSAAEAQRRVMQISDMRNIVRKSGARSKPIETFCSIAEWIFLRIQ